MYHQINPIGSPYIILHILRYKIQLDCRIIINVEYIPMKTEYLINSHELIYSYHEVSNHNGPLAS